MMMMRLIALALVYIMLQSCSDDSFRGMIEGIMGDSSQSIPVVVAIGNQDGGIVKGSGAIDSMDDWDGGNIYVYAFRRDEDVSYVSPSLSYPMRCLVDASRDNGSLAGKKARIDAQNAFAIWENADSELIYPSGQYMKYSYDFFAYHIDDIIPANTDIKRYDDSVVISLNIDGSQDLMSSKATVCNDQLEPFTEREKMYMREYSYSFYTAQRNVMPIFNFKHHLVRLEFELENGVIREEAKTVTAHRMEVNSKSRAAFTVAAKDTLALGVEFGSVTKDMILTEEGGHQIPDNQYVITTRQSYEEEAEVIKMGGCLLVAPADKYDAYITLSERRNDGTEVVSRVRNPLKISYGSGGFEAGNKYKVKLTIYGATQIAVSVEMEPWKDGGELDMDMENDKPII